MFVDEKGNLTKTVSRSWYGCPRQNLCEVSETFKIIVTEFNPLALIQIKMKVHLRDQSEYQDLINRFDKDFDRYFPPLPLVEKSEYSEILTIPGNVVPFPYRYKNSHSSSFFLFPSSRDYDNAIVKLLFGYGNIIAFFFICLWRSCPSILLGFIQKTTNHDK